jgi:hypothetical protein
VNGSSTVLNPRLTRSLLVLLVVSAFSFGAIVKVAFAASYHTTCVGHGFVAGSSQTDGSFFSRVESGCSSSYRHCAIYSGGVYRGEENIYDTATTCNAWSRAVGDFQECASSAHVSDSGVFSEHTHTAPNWCG